MTDQRELLNDALPDPALTRTLPPIRVVEEYVMPHVLEVRDSGDGNLAPLPLIGCDEWHRSSDAVKWATIAVAAMQGLWTSSRGPDERIAYSEGMDRVELGFEWAGYAYSQGYEKGRRDQKTIDRRVQAGVIRRGGAVA